MRSKVLLIGGSYPCPSGGGSINYIYNLLSTMNHGEVSVLTANENEKQNEEFDKSVKYNIYRSRCFYHVLTKRRSNILKYFFNILKSFPIIIFYVLKIRPRTICITEFSYFVIPILIISFLFRKKLAIVMYAEEISQLRNRYLNNCLFRLVFSYSSVIFTVSDYTSSLVSSFGDFLSKIRKIIPPIAVKPSCRMCKDEKDNIQILTVGRLERRKGQIEMIDVIVELHQIYPNLSYYIVGDGPIRGILEQKINESNAKDFIHMCGKVSNIELSHRYMEADIFAMPHMQLENGDTEGCPTVFLEASFNRLAVIGGNAGGVSDAIIDGKTGYIVDAHSKDLFYKIKELIDNKDIRKEMGNQGYIYSKQFVVDNQSEKFKKIILSI